MAALVQFFSLLLLFFSPLTTSMSSAASENYIIYMDSSVMPKIFIDHHCWYTTTLSSISSVNSHMYTYTNAIHGFSAHLSESELEFLKNCTGYIDSIRDYHTTLHTTRTPDFLGLNIATGAWPASSLGKDVIIGFVDTGVWPESASFDDEGMPEKVPAKWRGKCEGGVAFNSSLCNKKLIGVQFFNKGFSRYHEAVPTPTARDFEGHGTQVASIAAGNFVKDTSFFGYAKGTARGMAPRARVAIYKSGWTPAGYVSDDLAAIDQAIIDGVDVLSLSFGADGVPIYQNPILIATFAAMEKGVFVAGSGGNVGQNGLGRVGNGMPWILTVAAGTIDRQLLGTITLGNGVRILGTSLYHGNSTVINHPLVFGGHACNSVHALKRIKDKIILCEDRNTYLVRQLIHASKAGVYGAVFVTNITLDSITQTLLSPSIFLNYKDGIKVTQYIKKTRKPTITMDFQKTRLGENRAPMVASYSSRGPSQSFPHVLKPDIMAPGALILASWSPKGPLFYNFTSKADFNTFNIDSGTSMACPHGAGVAALLIGAHPDWTPAAIRSAMITTADYLDNKFKPIIEDGDKNEPASPLSMGAGHVNPNKALDPGLIYDATKDDYVRFLCAMNLTRKQIHVVTRSSHFNCSNSSIDLNNPSFIAFFNPNDTESGTKKIQTFHRTVTNVGNDKARYVAKVDPLVGFEVTVVPKKLEFKYKYEKRNYKLSLKRIKEMQKEVVYGSLTWVEVAGNHIVRSPIVATNMSLEYLAKIDDE